jgi:hypothetical protein
MSQDEVLRLVVPISGITLPPNEPIFPVEKDFVIAMSREISAFPNVYAIFIIREGSQETDDTYLARLSQFLDYFTYLTGQQVDFSLPPVRQLVAADAIAMPPFAQATVVYRISPQFVTGPFTAAADLTRKRIPRHLLNALTFYRRAMMARGVDEALIDLIVCLEAMFSAEAQEIRYRLSLRAAYFMGEKDHQLRREIFDLVFEMYGHRNRIMHSGETQQIDVARMTRLAQIVRNAIKKCVESNQTKKGCLENIDSIIVSSSGSSPA